MRASAFMAREIYARLRRRIAEIEGRPVGLDGAPVGEATPTLSPPSGSAVGRELRNDRVFRRGGALLSFGIPPLDRLLGGGLRRNALHEVRAGTTRDAAAATGFAAAVLARLTAGDGRPVLWVMEETAVREGGLPHGPGLDRFGLATGRLVVVITRRPEEVLWVFEEGLRCTGLAAVLAELRGHPRALDLTASRRLALRARDGGVMGLLLRQAARSEPGAAATRWLVEPQPAATFGDFVAGIGRPVWRLHLERNRAGMTGRFDLEWDHGTHSFALARPAVPALPRPRASAPFDRPDLAGTAGPVVAHRRAG
jgi:protein ImuA